MKQLIQYALCFCLSFLLFNTATAQMQDGLFAPDLSFTDLDGNSYNLYDILNEDKTLILELSATWCPPCWDFHNSGILENIHNQYGPNGTDEVRVFFFEADPSTNEACLTSAAGCNNTTQGNWVAGTPFPIANDNSIAQLYELAYFPTLYAVCPDRTIKLLEQSSESIESAINNCSTISVNNNVDARAYLYLGQPDYLCNEADPSFYMQNYGFENLQSATIELFSNGILFNTIDWTGDLATYDYEIISFPSLPIAGSSEIEIVISNTNRTTDDDDSNNTLALNLTQAPYTPTSMINIEVMTDNFGEEVFWRLEDGNGDLITQGGNNLISFGNDAPGYYENNTLYTESVNISTEDCFTFKAYDLNGNGWCCDNSLGYYSITDEQGQIIISGGEFTDYFQGAFRSIQSAPEALFTIIQEGSTINVIDQSNGATDWIWDWGDVTNYGTIQNPGAHIYAEDGDYEICLTVENVFGEDEHCETVSVSGLPTAAFNYEVSNGVLTFTDSSSDATSWSWNFGDGTTSTDQNPEHTFAADGEYEVCLSAGNTIGENEHCETIAVSIVGLNDAVFNNISIMPNPAINFVNVEFSQFKASIENIELINIAGQTVRNISTQELLGNTKITIDLTDLAEGIYFVNFTTDEGYYTEKLTIGK